MIGNKILKRINDLGKSNQWLADKLKTSNQYISSFQYKKAFNTTTLEKISKALNVPMTYWFEENEPPLLIASEPEEEYKPESTQVILRQILANTEKLLEQSKIK